MRSRRGTRRAGRTGPTAPLAGRTREPPGSAKLKRGAPHARCPTPLSLGETVMNRPATLAVLAALVVPSAALSQNPGGAAVGGAAGAAAGAAVGGPVGAAVGAGVGAAAGGST